MDTFDLLPLTPKIKSISELFGSFRKAACQEIILELKPPIELRSLRKTFIDFDKGVNQISKSKFQSDVSQMTHQISLGLKIGSDIGIIQINILSDNTKSNYNTISAIVHAINTFCHLFEYSYDGLVINICLDTNQRDIDISDSSLKTRFATMKQNSTAFNASGVTHRLSELIILSKKEEIIKLLFHELVHYAGLDSDLVGTKFDIEWDIKNPTLNLSEAYTESMAILLNAMYCAIQLGSYVQTDNGESFDSILKYEINYSLLLTANILKFYGYNDLTYESFFNPTPDNHDLTKSWSPIQTWEYIFVRTNLLLKLDNLSRLTNWQLNKSTSQLIRDVTEDHTELVIHLKPYMKSTYVLTNISYTCIEPDWSKL